ncbi:MAG: hypothetical protein AAGA48_30465 [Myxococcota bacterium]
MKIDVSAERIAQVIRLHDCAYAWLQWFDERGRQDPTFLEPIADDLLDRHRAQQWLEAHWETLPEPRPDRSEAAPVAGLLASFFSVSFQIAIERGADGRPLQARILHRPTSKRKQRLGRTEVEALQRLAIDAGHRPRRDVLHTWREALNDTDVELWLYVVELACRAEGRTQGLSAMGLWRRLRLETRQDLEPAVVDARARMLAALPL